MKGINLALYFVLAVVLIGLGIVLYNKISSWSCINDPFGCTGRKSDLEAAIECVMTICVNECGSSEVKSIKGENFDCNSYCEQNKDIINFIYNSGQNPGRFCGFQFPIKIEIPKGKTMEVDKRTISQDYVCFLKFSDNPKNIIKNLIDLPMTNKILAIKNFEDGIYSTSKNNNLCPPFIGEEIDGFKIKGKKILYVYGDNTPFTSEDGLIYGYSSSPITFISDELLYDDVKVNEEREITLKFREYYPLDNGYGLIIRDAVYFSNNCGDSYEPKDKNCDSSDWKICLDAFCGGKIENKIICSITDTQQQTEVEVCSGKYKLKPLVLPSSAFDRISDPSSGKFTPYVFSITRLS
jgi:hypothetical protein